MLNYLFTNFEHHFIGSFTHGEDHESWDEDAGRHQYIVPEGPHDDIRQSGIRWESQHEEEMQQV